MRLGIGFLFAAACFAAPDFAVRMLHQQGYDKGYGAGDRWTAADLEHDIPPLIDAASKGGYTTVFLNLEAGWINEAGSLLGVDLDAIFSRLIRYSNDRHVGLLIAVEYAGMEDKRASDAAFRQVRLFQISGAEARKKVSELRRPLCPINEGDYYLKAIRRALGWHPAALAVSFDDFPATHFDACRQRYGNGDIRFLGKALGKIATDVANLAHESSAATAVYILPRFYGIPHWKSHPDALPDLLATSPASVSVIIAGDPDEPYLKPLEAKHPQRFTFWFNLTSNHMKEKKVWFPTEELAAVQPFEKLRGKPGAKVIVNFGSPPEPQQISIVMSGRWLASRQNYDGKRALAEAARDLLGEKAGALAQQYARLLPWNMIRESLGWTVLDHLKDRARLPDQIGKWRDAEVAAREAVSVASAIGGQTGHLLVLNAERIQRDYGVAQLVGKVALDPSGSNRDALNSAVRGLEEFIQRYPVIANDVKDAEVVSRGLRFFQEYAANPERQLRAPADDK
jgi:hypothetical protein